ncbi:GNAT family N-acetyltransferase [Clostridioides sp. GD02404]|uniref:GNAT family N-acetyltransferase n=1 Tax=Clostridioides sp. GD02404 TaxID=3054354 RepID=UPI0038A5F8DB
MIESKRLYIRKMNHNDLDEISKILQDIEVMYAWEHAFSDEEVLEWIDRNIQRYDNDGYGYFIAIDKEREDVVGQIGLIKQDIGLGIGYIIKKEYWNQGYATEGAIACIDYAIKNLSADTLVADIRPENTASINVAKRLGMKKTSEYDKIYKGKVMKHDIYQLEVSGLTTKIVEVVEYNPNWKYEFEKLKSTLEKVLGDSILKIEHVGSTSVEGLSAKPRLDVDIVIENYNYLNDVISKLKKLGYRHLGNLDIEGREAFLYETTDFMEHNLYVCPKNGKGYLEHIKFRDYLRLNPDKVKEYSNLKKKLAKLYRYDVNAYCDNKTDFIRKIID